MVCYIKYEGLKLIVSSEAHAVLDLIRQIRPTIWHAPTPTNRPKLSIIAYFKNSANMIMQALFRVFKKGRRTIQKASWRDNDRFDPHNFVHLINRWEVQENKWMVILVCVPTKH